jgi:DNA-binding CsgD family transcriptional regulator
VARAVLEDELVPGRERIGALLPLAEGAIASAEGDFAAAAELIGRGLDARHPSLPRYLGAHLRVRLADALAKVGRLEEARAAAEAAVEELAQWPGWRHEAAEAQRRRTAASATSSGGGGDELTARERQIADLVAEGLSNGEVAARLYISPKTASVHVSNILAKLGLANRVEIAAWALGRRGDAAAPDGTT